MIKKRNSLVVLNPAFSFCSLAEAERHFDKGKSHSVPGVLFARVRFTLHGLLLTFHYERVMLSYDRQTGIVLLSFGENSEHQYYYAGKYGANEHEFRRADVDTSLLVRFHNKNQ